jgi:aminopeptidase-like protein
LSPGSTGRKERMARLVADLYPICRSIIGPGARATLERITAEIPIVRRRVASGTQVLDWTVPDEWHVRDAYVAAAGSDERVIDFGASNLHVVSHSVPVDARMTLDELQPHLHSLPDRPDLVPYRTSYYAATWGFCVSQRVRDSLRPGEYDVVIDAALAPGQLEWGELVIPGERHAEVLLTTHICHPSLANDNLSGIAALVEVGRQLMAAERRRYTYRLLFLPGTIGSLSYLATAEHLDRIAHGLVITGLADASGLTYKRSRQGVADIDRVVATLLAHVDGSSVRDFSPYGYDERQFCSPGFNLPVGRLTRGVHGEYPEYHTSADDLAFISIDQLDAAVEFLVDVLEALETNRRYRNAFPYGEPQLGSRGLYRSTGGEIDAKAVEVAYLWVLSGSDGDHDLCDIAQRSGLPFTVVGAAAQRLRDAGLLEPH